MPTESDESAGLLEQMKQELYAVIDRYTDRLKVDSLKSYIDSFSIPHVIPSQIMFSRLRELKRGFYLTPEVFKQIRQETPRMMSPSFFFSLDVYERDIEEYGEDSLAHLGLSTHEYHALKRYHVDTISKLRELDENGLLRIRNLGPKRVSEILRSLEEFDNLRTA